MNNTEMAQARELFQMYFRDPHRIYELASTNQIKAHKSVLFLLDHLFLGSGDLEELDFDLYSKSVNLAYILFKEQEKCSNPIHGNFYPELRQRYYDILNTTPEANSELPTADSHLAWMLTELSKDDMSETKKHRWLGYIQGCMTMKGYLVVNEERDATRAIFNGK